MHILHYTFTMYNVHTLYDDHIVQHQYSVKSPHVCLKRSCIGSFSSDFPRKKRIRRGEVGCSVKNGEKLSRGIRNYLGTKACIRNILTDAEMYEWSFLPDFATSLVFCNSVLWKNWVNILFHKRKRALAGQDIWSWVRF